MQSDCSAGQSDAEGSPRIWAGEKGKWPGPGVLSFDIDGSGEDAYRVAEALNLFTLARSLGGVDSLVSIPALTSHAMIDPELRRKMGMTEQMIRLSVGVENVADLIADLDKGLNVLSRERVQVGAVD